MKTIDHHDVKIFTNRIETSAMKQIERLLSVPVFSQCKIHIMPDVYTCASVWKNTDSPMQGIYSESLTEETKDESPMVYKPKEEIMENIQQTVSVVNVIKPVFNFKATERP